MNHYWLLRDRNLLGAGVDRCAKKHRNPLSVVHGVGGLSDRLRLDGPTEYFHNWSYRSFKLLWPIEACEMWLNISPWTGVCYWTLSILGNMLDSVHVRRLSCSLRLHKIEDRLLTCKLNGNWAGTLLEWRWNSWERWHVFSFITRPPDHEEYRPKVWVALLAYEWNRGQRCLTVRKKGLSEPVDLTWR